MSSYSLWWRLKDRRLNLGIGQTEAAALCGTSQSTYGRWENRKRVPEDWELDGIAEYLDVPRSDVVLWRSGEDAPESLQELRERVAELAEEIKLLQRDRAADPPRSSS